MFCKRIIERFTELLRNKVFNVKVFKAYFHSGSTQMFMPYLLGIAIEKLVQQHKQYRYIDAFC